MAQSLPRVCPVCGNTVDGSHASTIWDNGYACCRVCKNAQFRRAYKLRRLKGVNKSINSEVHDNEQTRQLPDTTHECAVSDDVLRVEGSEPSRNSGSASGDRTPEASGAISTGASEPAASHATFRGQELGTIQPSRSDSAIRRGSGVETRDECASHPDGLPAGLDPEPPCPPDDEQVLMPCSDSLDDALSVVPRHDMQPPRETKRRRSRELGERPPEAIRIYAEHGSHMFSRQDISEVYWESIRRPVYAPPITTIDVAVGAKVPGQVLSEY